MKTEKQVEVEISAEDRVAIILHDRYTNAKYTPIGFMLIKEIREAEERGRVEMREMCIVAVGFSNNAVAAIRALPATADVITSESVQSQ